MAACTATVVRITVSAKHLITRYSNYSNHACDCHCNFHGNNRTNICSYNGDIRLVNGAGPYEGRVEICYGGEWKTVCDDYWNTFSARIVCAQLNYPPQGE